MKRQRKWTRLGAAVGSSLLLLVGAAEAQTIRDYRAVVAHPGGFACAGEQVDVLGTGLDTAIAGGDTISFGSGRRRLGRIDRIVERRPRRVRVVLPGTIEPGSYWLAIVAASGRVLARGPESLTVGTCDGSGAGGPPPEEIIPPPDGGTIEVVVGSISGYEPAREVCPGAEVSVLGSDLVFALGAFRAVRYGQGATMRGSVERIVSRSDTRVVVELAHDMPPGRYWLGFGTPGSAEVRIQGPETLRVMSCVAPIRDIQVPSTIAGQFPTYRVTVSVSQVKVRKTCDKRTNGEWHLDLFASRNGTEEAALWWPTATRAVDVDKGDVLHPELSYEFRGVRFDARIGVRLQGTEYDRRAGGAGIGARDEPPAEERRERGGRHDTLGEAAAELTPAQWQAGGSFRLTKRRTGSCTFGNFGGLPYEAWIEVHAIPE